MGLKLSFEIDAKYIGLAILIELGFAFP